MGRDSRKEANASYRESRVSRFLTQEIRPLLAREGERRLAQAVSSAVAARSLATLSNLTPRDKRALLAAIDRKMEHPGRGAPDPQVVVELTGLLSPELGAEAGPGPRPVSPSR
ncbi:MAG: hypothetical protein L3K13_06590 [Thermoplasmata archaeon]|nr:hypothetical protein [Thermoplasmata archaeon]